VVVSDVFMGQYSLLVLSQFMTCFWIVRLGSEIGTMVNAGSGGVVTGVQC
jgi:hypothetical protein